MHVHSKEEIHRSAISADLSLTMPNLEEEPMDLSVKENRADLSTVPLNLVVTKSSRSIGTAHCESQRKRIPLNLIVTNNCNAENGSYKRLRGSAATAGRTPIKDCSRNGSISSKNPPRFQLQSKSSDVRAGQPIYAIRDSSLSTVPTVLSSQQSADANRLSKSPMSLHSDQVAGETAVPRGSSRSTSADPFSKEAAPVIVSSCRAAVESTVRKDSSFLAVPTGSSVQETIGDINESGSLKARPGVYSIQNTSRITLFDQQPANVIGTPESAISRQVSDKIDEQRSNDIDGNDSSTVLATSGIDVSEGSSLHVKSVTPSDKKTVPFIDGSEVSVNSALATIQPEPVEIPSDTHPVSFTGSRYLADSSRPTGEHSAGSIPNDYNDENDDDLPIGDATFLNMFSIEEYFESYHINTIVGLEETEEGIGIEDSSDDDNGQESGVQNRNARLTANVKRKRIGKCTDVDGDLGFQDISCEENEKQDNVCCNKVNKLRKYRGLSYTRSNGSTVPARCIKAECKCLQLQCYSKYSNDVRKSFLANLLKLTISAQNQFIANHITVTPAATSKVINSRRSYSRKYFLPGVGGMVRVCKQMFLSTLDISEKKARCLAEKKVKDGGVALDDQRCYNTSRNPIPSDHIAYIKSHILSFPAYTSHYGREKSTKKFLSSDLNVAKMYDLYTTKCVADKLSHTPVHYNSYRTIFKTFNLSFRKPQVDMCDTCDKLKVELQAATTESIRNDLEKQRDEHHQRAKQVYDHKKQDVEDAKKNEGVYTVSFDLQKCLPTPHLTTGRAYYSRQLYTYNLTVFVSHLGQNTAHCYLWDETKARRGSQEIGSCIFHFIWSLVEAAGHPVRQINLYSDKCSGQNHNFVLCMMLSYITEKLDALGHQVIITHNFMVSGHSHMEVDSIHAAIERAKKVNTMDIEIPRDWAILISQIRRKVPISVVELDSKDFFALKKLDSRYSRPKLNTAGEPLRFQNVMSFEYRTDAKGKIFYKLDPMDSSFSCFSIGDERQLSNTSLQELVPITLEPLELPSAKLEDLRSLLPYVNNKQYYQAFLKNLVAPKRGRKKKKVDQDRFDDDLSSEEPQ